MLRLLMLGVVLSVAGCQCLQPVVEDDDGGTGGGSTAAGGGSALGGGTASTGECDVPAHCTGAAPTETLCSPNETMRGFSCIDHRCVYECTTQRGCTFDADGGCLRCAAPAPSSCTNTMCGAAAKQAEVEQTAGCTLPIDLFTLYPTGGCHYRAVANDGGVVAEFSETGATIVGVIPGVGTCVGAQLFTQIERWRLACPSGCQFVLRL